MTKRAAIGKTITRKTRRAALPLEKPLFSGYNPSTATNYAENARKSEEIGPYGQLSAVSMTILHSMNLTGRKTAKNSNKGLLGTTHNLSLCKPLRTLLDYRVQPVGRPQSPDVDHGYKIHADDFTSTFHDGIFRY